MKKQVAKHRNSYVTVMRKRHPRKKQMTSRNKRRSKDAKNSWRREWNR